MLNEKLIPNFDIYSTDEVKTKKIWIDRKPIYRKVIYNASTLSYSNNKATINTSISNFDKLIKFEGLVYDSLNGWYNIPFSAIGNADNTICMEYKNDIITIEQKVYNNRLSNYIIIIEYTKTTD